MKQACIFGGGGFVGRHLAPRLVAAGYRCRVPTRHPQRQRELRLLPGVAIHPVERFDDATLADCCRGCELIVTLGDGDETRPDLIQRIVAAARNLGAPRLLHLSAFGSGETVVVNAPGVAATWFRAAPIFGRGDRLFTRLATLVERAPGFLPLPYPNARLAPVWVGDVAAALVRAAHDEETVGHGYDLCGPRVFYLRELVAYAAACRRRAVWIVGLNARLSAALARLPGLPFAAALAEDGAWCARRNGLLELGVHPTDIDVEVPRYLRVE